MNPFAQFLTGTTGMLVVVFVVITAILYFLIPWFIASISNKQANIFSELKSTNNYLKNIEKELKKQNQGE